MMRKEELCTKSRYYPCRFLEEVRNPKKISIRTAGLLPKIRTHVLYEVGVLPFNHNIQ
jgi:hypothetical protein